MFPKAVEKWVSERDLSKSKKDRPNDTEVAALFQSQIQYEIDEILIKRRNGNQLEYEVK